MNFDFATLLMPALKRLDWPGALHIAETRLSAIPGSEFHHVLENSIVGHADELAIWVNKFYEMATQKLAIKAMYFEMNEFDINTDQWFIDGFAYDRDGGLKIRNMDWLVDWKMSTKRVTGTVFVLKGYEKLQLAFKNIKLTTTDLEDARNWCEQIIIARFMELMRAAHLEAKAKGMPWANVPIYFTEHSYDFIVRSKV